MYEYHNSLAVEIMTGEHELPDESELQRLSDEADVKANQ